MACPNDPDDIRPLSEVAGRTIDEVFIGSCMTNIGHFRAAGNVLAGAPRTCSDPALDRPPDEDGRGPAAGRGLLRIFGAAGARTELPGCSLCMGNQARVADAATVFSTSTRNFPNRMGHGADVFLASAELAAVVAVTGKLPTPEEYHRELHQIDTMRSDVYRYLEFDKVPAPLTR